MPATFVLRKRAGKFSFDMVAGNGAAIAKSVAYSSKRAAPRTGRLRPSRRRVTFSELVFSLKTRLYAKCIDGQDTAARRRIEDALGDV